jgi:hypothetical protein
MTCRVRKPVRAFAGAFHRRLLVNSPSFTHNSSRRDGLSQPFGCFRFGGFRGIYVGSPVQDFPVWSHAGHGASGFDEGDGGLGLHAGAAAGVQRRSLHLVIPALASRERIGRISFRPLLDRQANQQYGAAVRFTGQAACLRWVTRGRSRTTQLSTPSPHPTAPRSPWTSGHRLLPKIPRRPCRV